jgi:hypothetical protein
LKDRCVGVIGWTVKTVATVYITPQVQELAAEVLGLPAQDRAKILEMLLSSFEPKPDSQKV